MDSNNIKTVIHFPFTASSLLATSQRPVFIISCVSSVSQSFLSFHLSPSSLASFPFSSIFFIPSSYASFPSLIDFDVNERFQILADFAFVAFVEGGIFRL